MSGLVVIPARGGSKRIPRKNLLNIGGRPMLERPIQTGLATAGVAYVLVSTDDDEIATTATLLGGHILGRRPSHLASDETPTAPVIAFEVEQYQLLHGEPEFVIVMYPTSVFITPRDLEQMISHLQRNEDVDLVMTATEYPAPIERAWRTTATGIGVAANPTSRHRQSQEFSEHFYDVGQAYVSRSDTWARLHDGHDVTTALHLLPRSRAWDINSPDDIRIAEALLSMNQES